jgi:predicted acylesterase/phospholipase RssA
MGPGPKRTLALDGGGLKGILTLGYLEALEQLIRQRHGNYGSATVTVLTSASAIISI